MREGLRDEKRAASIVAQFYCKMLAISLRVRPQIYNDVMNFAAEAADQFRFTRRRLLEMHPAEGSRLLIEREVPLRNLRIQTLRLELTPTVTARKKTARILMRLEVDKVGAFERSFGEYHWVRATAGGG